MVTYLVVMLKFYVTHIKKRGGTKMNEVFAGIANLGFPIVVSIYLLVRVEGKLDSLTNSINELAKAIAKKD